MPAALTALGRILIQTLIQVGAWALVQGLWDKVTSAIKKHEMEVTGLDEQDAQLETENHLVDWLIAAGVTFVMLKSHMPSKVADKFGFTTKGLQKRILSPKGEAKVKAKKVTLTPTTKTSADGIVEVANTIAKTKGVNLVKIGALLFFIDQAIALPTRIFQTAAQYIDYANWEGPYQGTFQKILAFVGIYKDKSIPKSKVVSNDTWQRIDATIKQLKPISIYFPWSGQTKPYSQQALVDLVNEVAAQITKEGGEATYKNVIGIVLPLIHLQGGEVPVANTPTSSGYVSTPSQSASVLAPALVTPKVFTGIVSQGILQPGLVFEGRQDDLIESISELREAATNNITPFLRTLPGRVSYEIKVVSSIVTKDGFKQTGTTQQLQAGTYKNGTPKFKTVTNKFAVMDLYVMNDKNTRTKITTIVLGPTNSAKLIVQQNDLRALETALPSLVTTSDPADIYGTSIPDNSMLEPTSSEQNTNTGTAVADDVDTGFRFYKFEVGGEEYIDAIPWAGNVPFSYTPITRSEYVQKQNDLVLSNPSRWQPYFADIARRNPTLFTSEKSGIVIRDGIPYVVENVSGSGTASAGASGGRTSLVSGASAATLSEWYQSQGRSLPSVEERASLYAQYGLGQATYYTGTSEQNTKLLAALKGK